MKTRHAILGALLASGPLLLSPSDAGAGIVSGFYTAPNPTLSVTSKFTVGIFGNELVSFTGSDFCGSAYHELGGTTPGISVTCGHTVFVGIWQPGPDGGGVWAQSVTLLSTPGGFQVSLSNVGDVSGSFDVGCGSPSGELYAYDLDDGLLIAGASVSSFACVRFL
jgi:hypothetical protein